MVRSRKQKYRPGIDALPPTRWQWFAGLIGVTAVAGALAAFVKSLRKK